MEKSETDCITAQLEKRRDDVFKFLRPSLKFIPIYFSCIHNAQISSLLVMWPWFYPRIKTVALPIWGLEHVNNHSKQNCLQRRDLCPFNTALQGRTTTLDLKTCFGLTPTMVDRRMGTNFYFDWPRPDHVTSRSRPPTLPHPSAHTHLWPRVPGTN